ncbi:Root meristem growth factor [Arachis hypogaea]|nr:Root meristem growth factor [Arachis hypogaea]
MNRLLLVVAFLLLCFMSMTARGRSLREIATNKNGVDDGEKGHQSNVFKRNHEGTQEIISGDIDTMDYTPAKKNPPIHN